VTGAYGRPMARLLFSAITSLDGYVVDTSGDFSWAEPDEEVHAAVNDDIRGVGTYLYGRRLYEVMGVWETMGGPEDRPVSQDFARIWRGADKVVYSTTLDAVSTPRTRLERSFDPDAVRHMVAAADRDVAVGGPTLAAHAFRAGLIDECHLYVNPVIVGGGTRALPDDVRLDLELVGERRFGSGVVYLHHRRRR
jgi:dihydrofolate reductase